MCYGTMWRYMVARCGTPIIHSWIESPDANGMTRFGTTFSSIDCSGRCFNCSGFKIIVVIVIVVIIRCKSGIIAVMCNSVKVRIRDWCNIGGKIYDLLCEIQKQSCGVSEFENLK